MSVAKEKENKYVEYEIQGNIKELITDDFLREFRNQLFRVYGGCNLGSLADGAISLIASTSGWYVALGKACLVTHNEALLDYWNSLPWYDSDVFDDELVEMLIERHFILGDMFTVIENQLGVKKGNLATCCDCGGIYLKNMMVELPNEETECDAPMYRCLYCNDVKNSKNGNKGATDYYQECFKEIKAFNR